MEQNKIYMDIITNDHKGPLLTLTAISLLGVIPPNSVLTIPIEKGKLLATKSSWEIFMM